MRTISRSTVNVVENNFKPVVLRVENYNGKLSNFQNCTFHKDIILLSDEQTTKADFLLQVLSLNFVFQKISTAVRSSHSSLQAGEVTKAGTAGLSWRILSSLGLK